MKSVRTPQEIRNAVFLAVCPSNEAMAWLRNRAVDYSAVYGTSRTFKEDHLPEYILFRRADPAIDVALAEHGRSRTVLRKLYDRACSGLRATLCSNASLFVGDYHCQRPPLRERTGANHLWDIVRYGPLTELRALCANPGMTSGFYGALIKAWPTREGREPIDEGRFRMIVNFLSYNPRISQSREESKERHYLDGFADYEYNEFYSGAWNLATTVPTTPEWAEALATLFYRLHRPYNCLEDLPAVLARWTPESEEDYGPCRRVREAICSAFIQPTLEELRHFDPAHRTAFLQKFDPESRDFRELDWNELATADRFWHLTARSNMKIWASASGRSKFRAQLWADSRHDNDMTAIGFFDEEAERLREIHPEWFAEPEHDGEANPPEPDPINLLRAEVSNLVQTMTTSYSRLVVGVAIFIGGLLAGHWIL